MGFFSNLLASNFVGKQQPLFAPPKPKTLRVVSAEPHLELKKIWIEVRQEYFPERHDLDKYNVVWSGRRQTRSLASCHTTKQKVIVAPAMKHPQAFIHIRALLYHEMCHAYLGKPKVVNGRRVMHGKDFYAQERRHPQIPTLNKWIKEGGWDKAVRSTRYR